MTLITGIHVVRSETSTPQPEACAQKDDHVFPRSSQGSLGSYDPFLSTPSYNLSSATGVKASSREGPSGQESVSLTNAAISIEPGGASNLLPAEPGPSDSSEPPRSMSASDQGKRPGLTRGRSQSQSGSSRRPGGRQSGQTSSQQRYDIQQSSNPPEIIHNVPGAPVGFHGPPSQFASPSSPYDQRATYGGQYTVPSPGPMAMGLTPPPFPYVHGFHHSSGLRSPQDPSMLPPNMHAGFSQMMPPSHGPVYPYQRTSPESVSPSHSFPGGYPQVAPSPPHSPLSAQVSGTPTGAPLSTPFVQPGQFHSLQYSASLPPSQYAGYTSQAFPSSPSIYQSQYAPSPYSQNLPPSTSDAEGQGTWWYLPHGSPPSHQYEGVQPPYPAHFPMGYSHVTRRDVETPYSPTGLGPPAMYPLPPRSHPSSRMHQPSASSPSAAYGRMSPRSTSPAEPQPLPTTNTSTSKLPAERPAIRRPYHPNPPAQRSEWVMWAGNVPSDTVHDELWRFFKQQPSRSSTRSASPVAGASKVKDDQLYDGVSSIFLISRSNCAFINFESEAHLHRAIERFNGKPLRPNDPRCPRLLCRVRRKDDDLKAGVGGQRGMGIHTRWIKDRESHVDSSTPSEAASSTSAEHLGPVMAGMSLSSDEEHLTTRTKQSSSGSYASTNSSILTRYFPKRYFILKSLTQFDLDLSVEKGLWATQRHNEGILDQAYRTSKEVYLIFGVNKSGEFYGYAKMAGLVLQGEHQVSWASRTNDSTPSSRSSLSPITGRGSRQSEEAASPSRLLRRMDQPTFFSPVENRLVEESPVPLSTPEMDKVRDLSNKKAETSAVVTPGKTPGLGRRDPQSAPAELGPARPRFTKGTPRVKQSLGTGQLYPGQSDPRPSELPEGFELDPAAPIRAQRNIGEDSSSEAGSTPPSLNSVAEDDQKAGGQVNGVVDGLIDGSVDGMDGQEAAPKREGWGESFRVEWLCTERLPFHRTRHLRNPWNHDREIKVSRDGTELEPGVGQRLLDEWMSLATEPPDADQGTAGTSRRAAVSAPALSVPQTKDSLGGKGGTTRS